MVTHNIEIEIRPDGEVKVHIKGAKGKQCMKYVEFLKSIVGPVKSQQLTHEYYEPEPRVGLKLDEELHIREEK